MKTFVQFLVLALIFGVGCVNMRRDEYGRALPRYPRWSLKHKAGDPYGVLRYDVVYVRLSEDKYHPGYEIMRFWPSGHYLYKHGVDLALDPLDSFHNSVVGYYYVESPRCILVEFYSGMNFGQYGYIRCALDTNGDLLKISSGPSWTWWHYKYPEPIRYTPHYVGELKLQPDW